MRYLLIALSLVVITNLAFASESIDYLINNFNDLATADNAKFWNIIDEHEKRAFDCKNPAATAEYLKLADVNVAYASPEFNEYFQEIIEKQFLRNPRCFVKAAKLLPENSQKNILYSLKHPLFQDSVAIDKMLKKYWITKNIKRK